MYPKGPSREKKEEEEAHGKEAKTSRRPGGNGVQTFPLCALKQLARARRTAKRRSPRAIFSEVAPRNYGIRASLESKAIKSLSRERARALFAPYFEGGRARGK